METQAVNLEGDIFNLSFFTLFFIYSIHIMKINDA